jgi:hypothetical protein
MIIFKMNIYVYLGDMGNFLKIINIERLNIFCINNKLDDETIHYTNDIGPSDLRYVELNSKRFSEFINSDKDFWEYNKNSLYILRNGNFLDIKNIFATINGIQYNVGRGSSQKAHALSPLDLRLSYYTMGMFNFNSKAISAFNYFDEMNKDRYLSYKDMSIKKIKSKNNLKILIGYKY